mgnify:CR=1 FL=1
MIFLLILPTVHCCLKHTSREHIFTTLVSCFYSRAAMKAAGITALLYVYVLYCIEEMECCLQNNWSLLFFCFAFPEKFNVLWRQNWTIEAKKKLSEFEGELFIKFQSAGYKGEGENEQWSFPGALLYAVTVISTIGKKHWLKITQKVSFYNIAMRAKRATFKPQNSNLKMPF